MHRVHAATSLNLLSRRYTVGQAAVVQQQGLFRWSLVSMQSSDRGGCYRLLFLRDAMIRAEGPYR